uniref:Uncharacterized protein n=1 Tax=Romanomermis culicivorax TaxID=13658 RepID=A0A915HI64_ROMCU
MVFTNSKNNENSESLPTNSGVPIISCMEPPGKIVRDKPKSMIFIRVELLHCNMICSGFMKK